MRTVRRWLLSLALCAAGLLASTIAVARQEATERPLLVGINSDFPPYEFVDENGEPAGFDVDMIRAVAAAMGLRIEVRAGAWSDVRGALQRGELDIVAGMLRSESRAQDVDFSHRHKEIRYSAFVRKGGASIDRIEDLLNRTVIVESGSLMHDLLRSNGMRESLILVASEPEALRLLASGEYDCAIAPLLTGKLEIDRSGLDNIEAAGPPIATFELCFAVSKGNAALLRDLDAGLEIVARTGVRDRIYDKWFGAVDPVESRFDEAMRYLLWIGAPLLALLSLALLWMRLLSRQVAERTKQLAAELEERKRTEEALRRSEAIREHTEEISLVMVAHVALGGQWLRVPRRLCELVGYSEEELLSKTWRDITHPADVSADQAQRDRLIRGQIESFEMEKRYIRKDGSTVWVDINCSVVKGEDDIPRYMMSYIRDVTARRHAQDAMRRSEVRYRSLVQATTSIIWTTNAAGEFIEPQDSWELYTGQPWEEHRGNGWARMIHPDDLPRVSKDWERVLTSGEHYGIEGRLWHKSSGEYRRFEANGVPIRGSDGEIEEWIGTIFDVEDKLRAQTALKMVESRFQQMAEAAPDVFWFADLDPLRVRYVNPAFERIWGEPAEAIYANSYLWQKRIHPEDRPEVAEAFTRFIQSDGSVQYAAEYRVVRSDGEVRWISDRGVSMRVDRGSVRSIAGIASDITERKENERRQGFMMQELDHRVKNNLAAVLSVAETTLANSHSLEEFSEAFRGRILALARSHVALAEAHWKGVDLKRLVEQTLSPYQGAKGGTVEVVGESLVLPPGAAAGVSMTLNELCTNAVKHGALSRPTGHVRVDWRLMRDDDSAVANGASEAPTVALNWTESGGPAASFPEKQGMGLTLMRGLIGHELAGNIVFQFDAEGLKCSIRFPLHRTPSQPVLD